MAWQIDLSGTARKQLGKIGKQDAQRIVSFLRDRVADSDDPRRVGKALSGPLGGLWRYRVGDFRIVCELQDKVLRVLVIRIGHRREVYRAKPH